MSFLRYVLSLGLLILFSCRPQPKVRNVILVIGDGMGPQQVSLGLLYRLYHKSPLRYDWKSITRNSRQAMNYNYPAGFLVVDSAASATHLATGQVSRNEFIGVNAGGQSAETILEKAHKAGLKTALVSDTRITHATPAAFAAHIPDRLRENEIAAQMLDSGADVLFSGGLRHFLPQEVNDATTAAAISLKKLIPSISLKSKRKDSRNLLVEAQQKGYALAFDRASLAALQPKQKALGLFAVSGMPDGITADLTLARKDRTVPDLSEMTQKALELIENPRGFFMMVEAGQIDWAAHLNDAGTMLHELLKLERTMDVILRWAEGRDDTIVLLTADHETGSFGFGYHSLRPETSYTGYDLPGRIRAWPNHDYASPESLDKLYAQKISHEKLLNDFLDLPPARRTAQEFMRRVNANFSFRISLSDAAQILRSMNQLEKSFGPQPESNSLEKAAHADFYSFGYQKPSGMISRMMAPQSSVVFATGGHTSTLVPVFLFGAVDKAPGLQRFQHNTETSRAMMMALGLRPPN